MALTMLDPWNGAHGAIATAANTGYAQVVKTDASATMQFTNARQWRGKNAVLVTGTTSAGYALGVQDFSATTAAAYEQPVEPVVRPASEQAILSFHTAADTRMFSIVTGVSTVGAVRVRDGGNVADWTSAADVLQVGVPVFLSVYVKQHATAGEYRVIVYNADGTVRADSTLRTAKNTGASPYERVKSTMAKSGSTSTVASTYYFGVPRYDLAATGILPLWTEHKPVCVPHPETGAWADATLQIRHPVTGGWVTIDTP